MFNPLQHFKPSFKKMIGKMVLENMLELVYLGDYLWADNSFHTVF